MTGVATTNCAPAQAVRRATVHLQKMTVVLLTNNIVLYLRIDLTKMLDQKCYLHLDLKPTKNRCCFFCTSQSVDSTIIFML